MRADKLFKTWLGLFNIFFPEILSPQIKMAQLGPYFPLVCTSERDKLLKNKY